ncbi:MAG: DUF4391 domain-containing protein [Candidatus Schekmanbacteria bacterium]|nr:DUF4391 domain-containing protein [Candidatus Schekmanbacteria bacterium]
MNATELLSALDLPAAARVDRRVPKTLLLEHGAPTAADKRRIGQGIERLTWVATLKPGTVGIAVYRDAAREVLEIAVLHLTLRPVAKLARLVELVHRAVPYPVVAVTEQGETTHLSLAHKRWSQGEAGKTVLDDALVAVAWREDAETPHDRMFRAALALGRQPQATLQAVYHGWMDTATALQAARRTGTFVSKAGAADLAERRDALQECERLEAGIARLRAAASREKQVPRLVELNLELKRVEAARAAALAKL